MISTQTTVQQTAQGEESYFKFFGSKISIRAFLTIQLVTTLCYVVCSDPANYSDTFKLTVTAIISFYFGQQTKR